MPGSPLQGQVVSFDEHVGLGEVSDGERSWVFHCTTIVDGSRSIEPGSMVSFRVGPGGPGRWEAFELQKLAS